MNKQQRSVFEDIGIPRFLSALRSLDITELPALPPKTLSKRQKKRIYRKVQERIRAYEHPMTDPIADLHEDAVEYSPIPAYRRTLSSLAACLVLCVGLVAGGVYFREDIAAFLEKTAYYGEPGAAVTEPSVTEAHGTDPISDAAPAVENTQFTLDLAEITYGGTDTAMVLSLTPRKTAPDAAVVEVGRYTLSLWDDTSFPNRWLTKIDVDSDPPLTFTQENGFETMLILDGHRIDENEKWRWKLELHDITVTDEKRNETKLDGYISMQFNTRDDSVVTLPEVPESACFPEDVSETMDLAVSYTVLGGNTVEVDFRIIPKQDADITLGFALYYETRVLEKWEDGAWVTVSSEDRLYDPLLAIMAGEIDFAVYHANGLSTLGKTTLTYDLDPGVYRLTLRGITSIREAAEGETAEMFDRIAEEIESGSVSGMFAISTK